MSQVYVQNALLTFCILIMALASLTVVGLLVVVPLWVGLYHSAKERNSRSVADTTRAAQLLLLVVSIGLASVGAHYSRLSNDASQKLLEYKQTFPYRAELDAYEEQTRNHSPWEIAILYGTAGINRINRIDNEYSSQLELLSYPVREYDSLSERWMSPAYIALGCFFLLQIGWRLPLEAKINNGEIYLATRATKTGTRRMITGHEALRSYSVADELLKWTTLRDNGTITEDEYKAARARLLSA